MMRVVYCKKLKQEGEGLNFSPYPGELGERIYNHISKEAWDLWLKHQTMLINEYRLDTSDPQSRQFLREQMERFLFEESETAP